MVFTTAQAFPQSPSAAEKTVKPPSQKEMQAQIKQAKADAQQQISDLEKQIAEAKMNNESAETIKGLEDQLALMKKMIGVIDQATDLSKKSQITPETKPTVIDKFMSPFEPIQLNQTVKSPAKEQATDALLWYKGKKIDAHTLITPLGMLVRYDKQRNAVIVQPDKKVDTTYYGLLKTLAKTGKMKNDFVVEINGILNSFLMYPEIKETYDEFDMVKDRFYDLAKNVINLPRQLNNLEQMFTDLTSTLNSLPSVTALAMPPEEHRPICPCGSNSNYENDLKAWLQSKLWTEEDILFGEYMEIFKYLEDGSKKATVAQTAILKEAIKQFIVRKTQKLLNLYNAYISENIYLEDGLVLAAKAFRQQLSEIGTPFDELTRLKWDSYDQYDQIKRSVFSNKVFTNFIEEQKRLKNYPAVLDYNFVMKHELNKQIFDEFYDIPYKAIWEKTVQKYNRFTLNIHLSFTLEQVDEKDKPEMIATGELTSDPVTISLCRDGCNWSFHLTSPDYRNKSANENIFYIPFNVTGGTKDYTHDSYPIFHYNGPPKMMMVFPIFRTVFCEPPGMNSQFSPDTIIMNPLRYTEAAVNSHISSHHVQSVRGLDFGREYSLDMMDYVNRMFIVSKNVQDNAATFVDITSRMLKIPEVSSLPPPTTNAILNQLFAVYNKELERKELQYQMAETVQGDPRRFSMRKLNSNGRLYNTGWIGPGAMNDKAHGYKMQETLVNLEVVHTPQ